MATWVMVGAGALVNLEGARQIRAAALVPPVPPNTWEVIALGDGAPLSLVAFPTEAAARGFIVAIGRHMGAMVLQGP